MIDALYNLPAVLYKVLSHSTSQKRCLVLTSLFRISSPYSSFYRSLFSAITDDLVHNYYRLRTSDWLRNLWRFLHFTITHVGGNRIKINCTETGLYFLICTSWPRIRNIGEAGEVWYRLKEIGFGITSFRSNFAPYPVGSWLVCDCLGEQNWKWL